MNKYKFQSKILAKFSALLFALVVIGGTFSCTEDIDESNFAIADEPTITEFLSTTERYSGIKAIFDKVRFGTKANASVLSSVLSSRGHYTVFVPSDSALNEYVKTLGKNSVEELDSAEAELIAYSCVIDNGDNDAYETTDFPIDGSFSNTNLNDRMITCKTNGDQYVINGSSNVVVKNSDVELSNGFLHEVDHVIAPSSDNLADMIAKADNMQIFAHLLDVTAWSDSLMVPNFRQEYEDNDFAASTPVTGIAGTFQIPQRIYVGFTALVETDDVYQSKWGITLQKDANGQVTNWDEVMAIVNQKCKEMFSNEPSSSDELTNSDNAVNRFVAYHLLDGKMAYNRFVRHYNEYNFKYSDKNNVQSTDYPVNVWDYYPTLGKYRGLVKITQVGDTGFEKDLDHKIYANRISYYNNTIEGDYTETGVDPDYPGILISATNGEYDNNAQNGFYYPINNILDYGSDTQRALGSERIRFDLVTILPEFASNNFRGMNYYYFPEQDFFKNIIRVTEGTNMTYLTANAPDAGDNWSDYQGDEMLFTGLFDFTLRLPPVPADGTYELRMGTSNNPLRGMCQVYFGSDPYNLAPAGLPIDLRLTGTQIPGISQIWTSDDGATEAEIIASDKNLKNQGYMKGPKYGMVTGGKAETTLREAKYGSADGGAMRRIIVTTYMKKDKTYYLRFKSALKKLDSQFFLDYFEFVPTNVYSGTEPEDIW